VIPMNARRYCLPALALIGTGIWAQGCGGSAPAAPTTAHVFDGSWSGTLSDVEAGTGTVRVELVSDAAGMRGSWSTMMSNGSTSATGTLAEYLPGESATTRSFDCGCTLERKGVLTLHVEGQRLSGRYFLTDCPGLSFGTMEVTKGG
jgi:hypothetical protein